MPETTVKHVQTGTDSLEIGEFKNGRVKIHFSEEESRNEQHALEHIERMGRLRRRAKDALTDEPTPIRKSHTQ